jgi:hypothetical protein
MILLELEAIGINILFGIYFYISLNAISLLFTKKNPFLSNLIYFLITLFNGLIYILYIDKIFLNFNFYYLLFITIGFYLAYTSKYLKLNKQIPLFKYLIKKLLLTTKYIFLFLINYKLWISIIKTLKKKKK